VASPTSSRPGRTLVVCGVLSALLFGFIWLVAPDRLGEDKLSLGDKYTPRLALDLEGGTSVILTPRSEEGDPSDDQIQQAVSIIRNRVDGFGVAEAEVAQAGDNIVISVPGTQNSNILDTVKQTAELRFRQVLVSAGPAPIQPAPTESPSPTASGTATPATSPSPSPTATTDERVLPQALKAETSPSPTETPAEENEENDGQKFVGLDAITPEIEQRFREMDCTDPEEVRQQIRRQSADRPGQILVTCAEDGNEKYILGPAELLGQEIDDATAGLQVNSQGATTGEWEVQLNFSGKGTDQFADITRRLSQEQGDLNRFGIVLDGLVVSAPTTNEPIPNGQASITGNFTQETANALANVLKYGSLPITFDAGSVEEVSATLGDEQLTAGIFAGLIGLALVVVYSLLYYRGLGLVTVASLLVAGLVNYGAVVFLGWQIGFRLSLAGVAGLIVAIGITADSFVVFFERLRDEVRDGKTLRVAVETGWARARRTILAADFVSLLAAVVLYALSVGSVRGFAFALGLTTVVDIFVVFLFTKPLVSLLARTKFFGGGHKLSGLDPGHLGAKKPAARRGPGRAAVATRTQEG
jgi:preprotein translocase subunit SecD